MSFLAAGAEPAPPPLSPREIVAQSVALAAKACQDGQLADAEQLYSALLAFEPNNADALHGLGVVAHSAGLSELAADLIGRALNIRDEPVFHNNLGLVLLALDRPHQALAAVYRALEGRRDYPEAYNALGNIQLKLAQPEQAIASFRRAALLRPDYAAAWCNLGKAQQDKGAFDEAAGSYAKAIGFNPLCAEAYNNLGNILRIRDRLDESLACFDKALSSRPVYAEALANKAVTLLLKKRPEEAIATADLALKIDPEFAPALVALGSARFAQGRFDDAIPYFRRAIARDGQGIDAWNNLGGALLHLNRIDEAIEAYDRSIELADENQRADAHFTLGSHLVARNSLDKGLAALDKALAYDPLHEGARNNRGVALQSKGEIEGAVAAYGQVMAINPDYAAAYSNRLMAMHYLEKFNNEDVLRVARIFGEHFDRPDPTPFERRDFSPDRRLRIGYVSGDFNAHPVAFFLERSLAAHDKARFEIFCYSNCGTQDYFTHEMRAHADHWRDIVGLSDDEAIELIRCDEIDILVDLAGHTNKTRILLFGRRPAPIQVAWLGYFGTTGLKSMDYLVLDPISAPPGADAFYTENLVRLPHGRFCYKPPPFAVDLADPPCLSKGHVTFGSFNNVAKIGAGVVSLWSQVLNALPDARLILKWRSLSEASVQERLHDAFAHEGVEPHRVELRGASGHFETLVEYNDIDIALDPFPFGGATTSCEALWMGGPVLTLPGDRLASRQTLGFLHEMGFEDLAASSPEDFVARAIALAGDGERLRSLRRALRPAMDSAAFCDGPRFTATLEAAYRRMWRRHVEGGAPEPFDIAPDGQA